MIMKKYGFIWRFYSRRKNYYILSVIPQRQITVWMLINCKNFACVSLCIFCMRSIYWFLYNNTVKCRINCSLFKKMFATLPETECFQTTNLWWHPCLASFFLNTEDKFFLKVSPSCDLLTNDTFVTLITVKELKTCLTKAH